MVDAELAGALERLSEGNRNVLFQLALRLGSGFSGEWRIVVNQGGIRFVEARPPPNEKWGPRDIKVDFCRKRA